MEVLSLGNTSGEMRNKRLDYFEWGAGQVWQIDPRKREMAVYASAEDFKIVHETDNIEGGDLLPGFSLPLAKIFEDVDRLA